MSKRARILGWALIALLPVLLLLGAEGIVRALGWEPPVERGLEVPAWLDRNILVKDARWMELLSDSPRELQGYYGTYLWDRHLFYRLRPNVSVSLTDAMAPPGIRERTGWTLDTNGRGYRGREGRYGDHPGVYRIVALGDSSTFGWGVEAGEAYPARLEEELRRRHPDRRIEVLNLGVCGYSSFQGLVLLRREALRYRPDMVTISYGSNDWSRVPEPFHEAYERNAGWIGGVRSLLHRSRAYQVYAAWLSGLADGERAAEVRELRLKENEMPLNVGPERSRENLESLVSEARAEGASTILVTNCVFGEMAVPVLEAARASGAPLLDTASLLRSRAGSPGQDPELVAARDRNLARYGGEMLQRYPELQVYLADRCHPNAAGHRIIAGELAALIERDPAFITPARP